MDSRLRSVSMKISRIINGTVFLTGRSFVRADLEIEEGSISSVYICGGSSDTATDAETLDASGLRVLPGLVDIHLHGCGGHDFCEGTAEAFEAIEQYELAHGITTILPATMSLPLNRVREVLRAANEFRMKEDIEHLVMRGVNLEGPFLSAGKHGAQNKEHLRQPDPEAVLKLWEESGGLPRIISIAPELDGAIECIRELSEVMTVSIAHTEADYDKAIEAFKAGASHVTHMFNSMMPFLHRDPGVVGAALDSQADVELICDGVHLHPSVVRAVFRMFDPSRIILISDSTMGTGMGDGLFRLGDQDVDIAGNHAKLHGTDVLAGSVTNLFDCMMNAIRFGVPEERAIAAATINPARSVGLDGKVGSISPGMAADLILIDENYNLRGIVKAGVLHDTWR
jgi:N-acetylglucosamine-6-phosphate deacetylase